MQRARLPKAKELMKHADAFRDKLRKETAAHNKKVIEQAETEATEHPVIERTYDAKTTEMIEKLVGHLREYEENLVNNLNQVNIPTHEKYRLYSSDKYREALRDRITKFMAMTVPKIVVHVEKDKVCQHSISPTSPSMP